VFGQRPDELSSVSSTRRKTAMYHNAYLVGQLMPSPLPKYCTASASGFPARTGQLTIDLVEGTANHHHCIRRGADGVRVVFRPIQPPGEAVEVQPIPLSHSERSPSAPSLPHLPFHPVIRFSQAFTSMKVHFDDMRYEGDEDDDTNEEPRESRSIHAWGRRSGSTSSAMAAMSAVTTCPVRRKLASSIVPMWRCDEGNQRKYSLRVVARTHGCCCTGCWQSHEHK
jgi:hypothetical protein